MLDQLFAPPTGTGELALRLTLGIVFAPHGWQKMKGPSGFAGGIDGNGPSTPPSMGSGGGTSGSGGASTGTADAGASH